MMRFGLKCLFIFFVLLAQGCATSYSAKSVEGWVVDADSGQPLEGVNVVAHWALAFGLEGGQRSDLTLMETLTDKNGRYYFPEWGPTPIPSRLPPEARLKFQDPELIYFKSGYSWEKLSNQITGPHFEKGPSVRTSEWNGKTIKLKKFQGTPEQFASLMEAALTGVSYGRCEWKKIPRIFVTLTKEKARLKQLNVASYPPTIEKLERISVGEDCGSVQEFFEEYLK